MGLDQNKMERYKLLFFRYIGRTDGCSDHVVEKQGKYIKKLKKRYANLVDRYAEKGKNKHLRVSRRLGKKMAANGLAPRALRLLHEDVVAAILTTHSTDCEGVKADALLPLLQLISGYGHADRRDRPKDAIGPAVRERQLYHTVRCYFGGDGEQTMEPFFSEMQACLQGLTGDDPSRRIDISSLPAALRPIADALNTDLDRVAEKLGEGEQGKSVFQRDLGLISQSLDTIADGIGMRGGQLLDAAETMGSCLHDTIEESGQVRQRMAQAASGVNAINQTIGAVTEQIQEAGGIARDAVGLVGESEASIAELAQVAHEIGAMVSQIAAIAKHTRTLSINATIESVRAGEEGDGFGVVASEVKDLAVQTSKTTHDISRLIADIQQRARVSTSSMQSVAKTVARVHTITMEIQEHALKQEQESNGISTFVAGTRQSAEGISTHLHRVSAASDLTRRDAKVVHQTARELRQSIDELRTTVGSFVGQAAYEQVDDVALF
ncbi:MAG: methyl-accepting chemotaxis protein [Mariprofundales bacterium]|nr:methyl-accepting chemotaxis protein [Mariprofundales bacterium]